MAASWLLGAPVRGEGRLGCARTLPERSSHIYRFLHSEFLLSSEPRAIHTWDAEWGSQGLPGARHTGWASHWLMCRVEHFHVKEEE